MSMTAVALSSFLPMWQHRLEAVLALLRGEPGQQVAECFRMTRSDLYKFRARAPQALRYALLDQPRGLSDRTIGSPPTERRPSCRACISTPPGVPVSSMST